MVEELCLRCKKKNTIINVHVVQTKNNRTRLVGKCEECDANVSKFINHQDAEKYAHDSTDEDDNTINDNERARAHDLADE